MCRLLWTMNCFNSQILTYTWPVLKIDALKSIKESVDILGCTDPAYCRATVVASTSRNYSNKRTWFLSFIISKLKKKTRNLLWLERCKNELQTRCSYMRGWRTCSLYRWISIPYACEEQTCKIRNQDLDRGRVRFCIHVTVKALT